ncbi:2474_t:CDS:2, partial [Acaulospora morrowiae]
MAENKSKQMDNAEYEKELNWPEIQITLTNTANKKDLEKGTKARIEAVQQYIRYLINGYQPTKTSEIVQQGLSWKQCQKGVYVDGHEHPDVIIYKKNFLKELESLEWLMSTFESNNLESRKDPELLFKEKLHILVTHNESIFYAYDAPKFQWVENGKQQFQKKGQGKGYHVSHFLTEMIEQLQLTPEEQKQYLHLPKTVREDLVSGTSNEEWWNIEKLVKQVKEKLIPLFEATHPECIMVACFNNTTSHNKYAEDALRANVMNLKSGGSYKIRDIIFNGQPQTMTLPDSRPKEIKMVLEEHKLWKK